MKIACHVFAALLMLCISLSVVANDAVIEPPIGNWVTKQVHSSGDLIEVSLEINGDNTFNGEVMVNASVNLIYSGVWEFSGNELTYIYKFSTKPMPENYRDVDIIIAVDQNTFTYKSKMSGKTNQFNRVN